MIFDQIQIDLKESMKARDADRTSTLRSILTAMKNALVADAKKDTLTDEESMAILKKLAKQRKESIEQFRAGDRIEMAEKEERELLLINAYLPAELSEDELKKLIEQAKTETGATTKADMGKLMGASVKLVAGRADGVRIKTLVEQLLS